MEQSRHDIPCTHGPGRPLQASILTWRQPAAIEQDFGPLGGVEACRTVSGVGDGLRTNEKCETTAAAETRL